MNKANLELRSEENLRRVDPKKMLSKKLLSNIHKEIKDVHKLLDEFENESEVHYYEVKK